MKASAIATLLALLVSAEACTDIFVKFGDPDGDFPKVRVGVYDSGPDGSKVAKSTELKDQSANNWLNLYSDGSATPTCGGSVYYKARREAEGTEPQGTKKWTLTSDCSCGGYIDDAGYAGCSGRHASMNIHFQSKGQGLKGNDIEYVNFDYVNPYGGKVSGALGKLNDDLWWTALGANVGDGCGFKILGL